MHIDPKQSLRLDVNKLPTPHWKKPLPSMRRTRGIKWLAISSLVMMTGCNTMNTIDTAGDQFEKGEYGWGIYTSTIGVAVSLLADIFTLGGTADPETGVSTVMKGGYQAEAGDTAGALQIVSSGFASTANSGAYASTGSHSSVSASPGGNADTSRLAGLEPHIYLGQIANECVSFSPFKDRLGVNNNCAFAINVFVCAMPTTSGYANGTCQTDSGNHAIFRNVKPGKATNSVYGNTMAWEGVPVKFYACKSGAAKNNFSFSPIPIKWTGNDFEGICAAGDYPKIYDAFERRS